MKYYVYTTIFYLINYFYYFMSLSKFLSDNILGQVYIHQIYHHMKLLLYPNHLLLFLLLFSTKLQVCQILD